LRSWHPTRRAFRNTTAALIGDCRGAIAVEYGLIAALVAIVILGSLKALGLSLTGLPLAAIVNALS
ncbi:MAG: Flp family type IVb pilin, partial [Geminicoccaceae bacterium]